MFEGIFGRIKKMKTHSHTASVKLELRKCEGGLSFGGDSKLNQTLIDRD